MQPHNQDQHLSHIDIVNLEQRASGLYRIAPQKGETQWEKPISAEICRFKATSGIGSQAAPGIEWKMGRKPNDTHGPLPEMGEKGPPPKKAKKWDFGSFTRNADSRNGRVPCSPLRISRFRTVGEPHCKTVDQPGKSWLQQKMHM